MNFVDFIRHQEKRPPKVDDLVVELKEKLFFCGSRSFAEKKIPWLDDHLDFSNVDDWDFSFNTKDNRAIVPYLKNLGFVKQEIGPEHLDMYSDRTFGYLYKHPDYKIDIVERFMFHQYKMVWESASAEFYYNYLWKSAPHRPQDQESIRQHKVFIRDWLNNAVGMFL
jgi:hypothetical protein